MSGEIHALEIGSGQTAFRRTLALLLPVLLLAALMLMISDRADASTAGGGAVAAASVSASSGSGAQFSIAAIVCPILQFLKAAFGPFFAGIFDSLLAAFGCVVTPSG